MENYFQSISFVLIYSFTRDCGFTRSVSTHCREGDRFESRPSTASLLKMLKMVPTAAMSGERFKQTRGMPWPKTGATHYHTQLGLPGKDSTIHGKGNVILTDNYKGEFPHNPPPLFLPFLPTLFNYIKKIYFHLTLKSFVIFCRIDCQNSYP